MQKQRIPGDIPIRIGMVTAIILCLILIPGCVVHYPIVGVGDLTDGNLDLFSEAMRVMENDRRTGEGAVPQDRIGENWTVRTILHLGGTHTVPPSRTTEYVVVTTDDLGGRRTVTVMILAPDSEPITRRTSFQSTAIIGENRCLLEAGECDIYGDERSPVVAVTFFHSNSAILVGWVVDDEVQEFTVELSNGRSLSLTTTQHRYFIGVVERRSTRRPSWSLPVVTRITALGGNESTIY